VKGRFAFGTAADAGRAAGDQYRFPQRACCGPGQKEAGVPVQDSNLTWLWGSRRWTQIDTSPERRVRYAA